ncbi:MAG TPA: acyltransferase [Myxococcaceae bacterium]|jgi:peptidoglycan/LPS O-acetylase OafA/YrhL
MASTLPLASLRRPPLHACTGLRFIAALGVVGYHFYNPSQEPTASRAFSHLLQAGSNMVGLFFVLSGFILAYNYLGERGGFVGSTWDFYRARFARIYPVYLLALVVDVPLFLLHLRQSEPPATAGELAGIGAATLSLTQAWFQTGRPAWNTMAWTLSVEAFFYALFPFLGAWLARQGSRRLLAVAAGVWLLGTTPYLAGALVSPGATSLLERGLLAWSRWPQDLVPVVLLPQFVLGVCLGVLFCRRTPQGSEAWRTVALLGTVAVLAAVVIALPPKPSALVNSAVLIPLFALGIWLLASGVVWNGLLLGTRPLVLLGGASYALYLMHGSMMGYALAVNTRTLTLPHNLVALLMVPVVVVSSMGVFKVLEEPARHWLRRLGRARSTASAPGSRA